MTFVKTVLAAALVAGSAAAFAAPASAQPADRAVVVEHGRDHMRPGPWMARDRMMHRPMHHDCVVRTTKTMRHGHMVVRKERMCR